MSQTLPAELIGHVRINGALFFGHHGIDKEEQRLGAQYEVDVDAEVDIAAAAASDRLHDAVNYSTMFEVVEDVVAKQSFHLLEAIAGRIAEKMFAAFPPVRALELCVRKLDPPVQGIAHSTEVILEIRREQWNPLP